MFAMDRITFTMNRTRALIEKLIPRESIISPLFYGAQMFITVLTGAYPKPCVTFRTKLFLLRR